MGFEVLRVAFEREDDGGDLAVWHRAATDIGTARFYLGGDGQLCLQGFGPGGESLWGGSEHPQDRDAVVVAAAVGQYGLFEQAQGDLVHAEHSQDLIFFEPGDEGFFADDDARLYRAEEFVATEAHQVGRVFHQAPDCGLGLTEPPRQFGQVGAAQIVVAHEVVLARKNDNLVDGSFGTEALDGVVGFVDFHQQSGLFTQSLFIIGDFGLVGGTHLDQTRATGGHHIGDTKTPANLDEFPARDDRFASTGKGIEDQKDRGGVVVDDQRIFGTEQIAQGSGGVDIPIAPPTRLEIVFEVAIPRRDRTRFVKKCRVDGGAAEIGVDRHSCGVDERLE